MEVFHHSWNAKKDTNDQFMVADVSSLYPFVSISNLFPTGPVEIITAQNTLQSIQFDYTLNIHKLSGSKLIGLALIRIVSPRNLKEPFLPIIRKTDDKVVYALCEECAQTSNVSECGHDELTRSSVLTLTWPDINFLVGVLNYKVMAYYELYNYKTEAPLFSKFVKLLAVGKLKHVISDKSEPNIQFINDKMKFPPSMALKSTDIDNNSDNASFFKKSLCSFLGKTAQVNSRTITKFVRNQSQLQSLFYSENIDDLFDYGNVCHVIIKPQERLNENRSGNSILYSYVTAFARIYMHKCIMKLQSVNACVYALENDAIYFTLPKTVTNPLIYSQSFGFFHEEYKNCIITSFNSLGTKSMSISYIENGILKHKIKAKGFNLQSSIITSIMEFESLHEVLQHYINKQVVKIDIPQVHVIKDLKHLSVTQVLKQIKLSNVIVTKRVLQNNCQTLPFGYSLKTEPII